MNAGTVVHVNGTSKLPWWKRFFSSKYYQDGSVNIWSSHCWHNKQYMFCESLLYRLISTVFVFLYATCRIVSCRWWGC